MAHAIPAYFMLAIQFPKGQCDQLDASVSRFWWSPKVHVGFQCHGLHFVGHKRRVAWVSGNSGILTKLFSPNLTGEFYPKRIVFVLRFEGEIQDSRQLVVSPFSLQCIPFLEKHDGHKTPHCKGSLPFGRQWGLHKIMVRPMDP